MTTIPGFRCDANCATTERRQMLSTRGKETKERGEEERGEEREKEKGGKRGRGEKRKERERERKKRRKEGAAVQDAT